MSAIVGGSVAVITHPFGMVTSTYESELDAVLGMISTGTLGGGSSFGCTQHIAALEAVEKRIAGVRAEIERSNREK